MTYQNWRLISIICDIGSNCHDLLHGGGSQIGFFKMESDFYDLPNEADYHQK